MNAQCQLRTHAFNAHAADSTRNRHRKATTAEYRGTCAVSGSSVRGRLHHSLGVVTVNLIQGLVTLASCAPQGQLGVIVSILYIVLAAGGFDCSCCFSGGMDVDVMTV